MLSLLKSTTLSILTVGSLAFNVITPVQAVTLASKNSQEVTNQTIYHPEIKLGETQVNLSAGESVASITCRTTIVDGTVVSCCADSDGNWACAY